MLLSFLKKYFIPILTLAVLVLIVGIIVAIYFINSNNTAPVLIDNNSLKQQAALLNQDSQVGNDKNFNKLINNLNGLDNKSLSRKEQLKLLNLILDNAINAYADTNDHKLYVYQKTLTDYINKNFPENGKIADPQCMDPACAQTPTPKEILSLINEINQSSVPVELKKEVEKELMNFSYINKDHAYEKTMDFLFVADDIKTNSDFVKSGFSEKWSDEIINYVKNAFPNEYNQAQQQL